MKQDLHLSKYIRFLKIIGFLWCLFVPYQLVLCLISQNLSTYLELSKVICYFFRFFYHGKSPLNHQFGRVYVLYTFFQTSHLRKSKFYEVFFFHPPPVGNTTFTDLTKRCSLATRRPILPCRPVRVGRRGKGGEARKEGKATWRMGSVSKKKGSHPPIL